MSNHEILLLFVTTLNSLPLSHVHIYVGEWIPFGANQIVSLNERLGSLDRCQGGLFTSMVDKNPTDTQFQVAAGLTQVLVEANETDGWL